MINGRPGSERARGSKFLHVANPFSNERRGTRTMMSLDRICAGFHKLNIDHETFPRWNRSILAKRLSVCGGNLCYAAYAEGSGFHHEKDAHGGEIK